MILAFTTKKMFYFNKKSEVPLKNIRQHFRNLSRKTVPLNISSIITRHDPIPSVSPFLITQFIQ
jgi:hypothetical protein